MKNIKLIIILILSLAISACQMGGGGSNKDNDSGGGNGGETDGGGDNGSGDSGGGDADGGGGSGGGGNTSLERLLKLAEHHQVPIGDYPNGRFLENAVGVNASRVECSAPCGVHFKANVIGNFETARPFHDLAYHWDFDDPNSEFTVLPGNFVHGRSANHAQGPYSAHVFERPGTYTVVLRVGHKNGRASHATTTVTVRDPNETFSGANTICVSIRNNFSGCPSGAQQVGSVQEAQSVGLKRGSPDRSRILFRAGEEFSVTTGFSMRDEGPKYFGKFGSGARPVLNVDRNGSFFFVGNVSEFTFTDIDIKGDYNPVTGEGERYDVSAFFTTEGTRDVTILNTRITGIGIAYYFNNTDGAVVANTFVTDWYNFGSFTSEGATRLAYIGNSIEQNVNAVSGPGAKERDILPRWSDHGPIRVAYAYDLVISHNKFFSNAGWSSNGDAHQPTIRYHSGGGTNPTGTDHSGVINKNELSGGFEIARLRPQNNSTLANLGNLVFERNMLVGTSNSTTFMNLQYGNSTVRNNLMIQPNVPDDGKLVPFMRFIIYTPSASTSDENLNAPKHVYGNTFLQLQSNVNSSFKNFHTTGNNQHTLNEFGNLMYVPNSPSGENQEDPVFDNDYKPAASFVENASNSELLFDTFYGNVRPENSTAGAVEK